MILTAHCESGQLHGPEAHKGKVFHVDGAGILPSAAGLSCLESGGKSEDAYPQRSGKFMSNPDKRTQSTSFAYDSQHGARWEGVKTGRSLKEGFQTETADVLLLTATGLLETLVFNPVASHYMIYRKLHKANGGRQRRKE